MVARSLQNLRVLDAEQASERMDLKRVVSIEAVRSDGLAHPAFDRRPVPGFRKDRKRTLDQHVGRGGTLH